LDAFKDGPYMNALEMHHNKVLHISLLSHTLQLTVTKTAKTITEIYTNEVFINSNYNYN